MELRNLSASELTKLDAICLDFESSLRSGNALSIDEVVSAHREIHAGLLREELEAVKQEIEESHSHRSDRTIADGATVSDRALPTSGTQIGPYVVASMIERGGMGVVYSATDTRLHRKVAIKMMAIEGEEHQKLGERFQREARAVAAISHPNIVELFDVGIVGSSPYAVMEFLQGETLDRFLSRSRLTIEEVRSIGIQIADALTAAHASGVVHRDLKPNNIMVLGRASESVSGGSDSTSSASLLGPRVKLFDFGLSRAEGHLFGKTTGEQTREGVVMGTPGYMAPEQARGEQAGPAADLFSLGCLLHEAFYGQRAFEGETATARFASTLESTPQPDPTRRCQDVPLARLIEQCLQKDPADRPSSAAEVVQRLRQPPTAIASEANKQDAFKGYTRRRFVEWVGGGLLGALAAAVIDANRGDSLRSIGSLAVLSFTDKKDPSATLAQGTQGQPVGDRAIFRGDQLAALLVDELSRMSDVSVTPFRPLVANTREQYMQVGDELGVDALVTGTFQQIVRGTKTYDEISLQIVSSRTGWQLWGDSFYSETGESLLKQARFASEIATALERSLTSTDQGAQRPSVSAFKCLVDGSARSDPDSPEGLRQALKCFHSAHSQDELFAAPLAGLGLTSIMLAAQTTPDESIELIRQARQAVSEAVALEPQNVDARLANAMLKWQTQFRYDEATEILRTLLVDAPNHWQIRHQLGLLELTKGRTNPALQFLREATQLNPLSVIAKVDQARAYWHSGSIRRALTDAQRIRSRHGESLFAKGLLIDLYESQRQFAMAAAEHEGVDFGNALNADRYFSRRAELDIQQYPYGPFGVQLNQAILQARSGREIDDAKLGELADSTPPMLPLLLATHPCFASARQLERAQETLPHSDFNTV
ncbi:serine/threonine-protein kinase [Novipirellula artificiosorum]|uniref:Serine/threonine-protein kinase Pkn1 n=1 Tax=Novipirellula artificiosorum TaxID=2528016 RepID=A0A5C6DF21_9BACT|nr:serine/threonine-protein kinase [Novipirellula artificiosorum]TWU33726.1 Serine/threonine-protein kinase Pkn1 [Novipirellula artificiosorum]